MSWIIYQCRSALIDYAYIIYIFFFIMCYISYFYFILQTTEVILISHFSTSHFLFFYLPFLIFLHAISIFLHTTHCFTHEKTPKTTFQSKFQCRNFFIKSCIVNDIYSYLFGHFLSINYFNSDSSFFIEWLAIILAYLD